MAAAQAAEPVRHIAICVQSYYEAARVAQMRADRAKNGMDEKFCWKS